MKRFKFGWGDLIALIQPIIGIIAWATPMPLEVKMNIMILLFILTGLVCFYFYRDILSQTKDILKRLDGTTTKESLDALAEELKSHREKEDELRKRIQEEYYTFVGKVNNRFTELGSK